MLYSVYILLGLAILSMCFHLVQEDIRDLLHSLRICDSPANVYLDNS